ncbi:MAG TPA: DUF11 domain-containing protein [Gemmataceae bacterium]|nr:DUF11 domain-containing protein [Gemmataceae bacterium]
MSNQRSTAHRLRVEVLEDRAVPAATGTDPAVVTPPADDPTKPAVTEEVPPTDTAVDGEVVKPTDPAPDSVVPPDVVLTDVQDPEVLMTMTGEPQNTDSSLPAVDLSVNTTVSKPVASIGDVITLTVQVTNNGGDPATGIEVDAALPAGLTFVSATGPGEYDAATGKWTVESVLPGAPASLQIKAKVAETGAQSISAAIIAADQPDPKAGNNTANTTVTPVLAGLRVTQMVNTPVATVGGVVLVTLTVRNMGPGTARNVAVTESFGPGLLFVRALPTTRGTFVPGTKVWNIPALASGMTATLQLVAQVSQAGRVEATATATGTGVNPDQSQLSATTGLTAVRTNVPATFSYFSGQGFRPGPAPAPRPTPTPTTPVLPPGLATSAFAQMLLARGFIVPSGLRL